MNKSSFFDNSSISDNLDNLDDLKKFTDKDPSNVIFIFYYLAANMSSNIKLKTLNH